MPTYDKRRCLPCHNVHTGMQKLWVLVRVCVCVTQLTDQITLINYEDKHLFGFRALYCVFVQIYVYVNYMCICI